MEMVLNNGFYELTENDFYDIEGGIAKWKKVLYITGGTILLANSLAIGVVATPGVGVTAAGTGLALIGNAF